MEENENGGANVKMRKDVADKRKCGMHRSARDRDFEEMLKFTCNRPCKCRR